jgi:hypothetical protein
VDDYHLVTLIVEIMVTCYMFVVNFKRHELSAFQGFSSLIESFILTLHFLCLNPKYDLDIILIQSRVKNTPMCAWSIEHDLVLSFI